jgi:hypothetical protein
LDVEELEDAEILLEKCFLLDKALKASEGYEWTHGCARDGVTCTYCPETDGTYSICLQGINYKKLCICYVVIPPPTHPPGTLEDVPLFELTATMLDINRYNAWFPLCNLSNIIHFPGINITDDMY